MDSHQGGTDFDFNMDFAGFTLPQQAFNPSKTSAGEGNTSPAFFFADEGIDTTTGDALGQQTFEMLLNPDFSMPQQPLTLDNTSGSSTWIDPTIDISNTFPPTPAQSFNMYTPQLSTTSLGKRPLQLDVQDFPQPKRHEGLSGIDLDFSPYPLSTTASSTEPIGLSDEAADVCATWFSKYNVLPSDRHIDSLSQLTGESATAIRQWFGQALKQGLGQDSAYKSQTSGFTQDPLSYHTSQTTPDTMTYPDLLTLTDTQTPSTTTQAPLRGGRKGCNPTDDPELLKRDPKKIYQCTRKCGKRYGRKCDWKRNEEEGYPSKSWICSLCIEQGVERVKPCFRKYHFSQHFRNCHPGVDCNKFEEASVVYSDTAFPKKCGFCTHRFASRQDRIDHIAEHFKEGKSMLEWNDNDNNDSDNTDDDDDSNDDRPGSGGSGGNQPFFSPGKDNQPDGSSSKDGGNGGGGGGGSDSSSGYQQQTEGGFFQFQLSQANTNTTTTGSEKLHDGALLRPDKPCVPSAQHHSTETSSTGKQRLSISPETSEDEIILRNSNEEIILWEDSRLPERRARKPEPIGAKDVDPTTVARDAFSQSIVKFSNLGGIDVESLSKSKIDGSNNSTVRALNALLTLLNPIPRAAPVLPPPLQPSDSLEDSSGSWLVSERSFLEGFITSQNAVAKPANASLQVASPSPAISSTQKLTNEQQYWKGITTLLDQQSFLSIKLLGTGGFSTVDEVLHRETSLRISRKTLKNRRQSALEELKKEVNVLQKLRHPHVIRFLGAYSKDDKVSILLSPVAETTLAVWLDQKSLEQPAGLTDTIVKMLGCLSSTLRYLHEQRPVVKHMDIKPQNILVMQGSQDFPHVVLSDFGISSAEETKLEDKHKPFTRQYCAPEVMGGTRGEQASDIWSLGCVFAEMATFAFSTDNPHWHDFRTKYRGRKTSYYWQDVPALQTMLTQFLGESSSSTEAVVVQTVKSMLKADPAERPDAAMLAMIFTPAPCCVSWPNDQASYPGPHQEMESANMYAHEFDHSHAAHVEPSRRGGSDRFTQVSAWLEECSSEHEACHHHEQSGSANVLPTRLVDLRPDGVEGANVRVLDSTLLEKNATPYAVLSYTWDSSDVTLTTDRANADQINIPRDLLSDNLENGIKAMQRIGFRYIWVDSLCVLQDSAEDKERECIAIANVYRNADITVLLDRLENNPHYDVSVSFRDGSSATNTPGISTDAKIFSTAQESSFTRDPVPATGAPTIDWAQWDAPGFSWDTRAWSLQERLLSRRILHLGAPQIYWECNGLKASETFPRGMTPLLWEKVHTKDVADGQKGHLLNVRFEQDASVFSHNTASFIAETCAAAVATAAATSIEKTTRTNTPKKLKTCQWIKKEGDGIGDSMEAAQMPLELPSAVTMQSANTQLETIEITMGGTTHIPAAEERSILKKGQPDTSEIVSALEPHYDFKFNFRHTTNHHNRQEQVYQQEGKCRTEEEGDAIAIKQEEGNHAPVILQDGVNTSRGFGYNGGVDRTSAKKKENDQEKTPDPTTTQRPIYAAPTFIPAHMNSH
ncbi:hypothetical protein DM02DRAFT_609459 [Periconia macrospinosa]|uniref:Protein kinase domain-containing protein n=1 Tax=Periconia macrospinosa TaxID=97972 RepID=A0A2V1E7S8_9PLEO|nr:hypothetical protein DM02DRAFT_609459 [Periconia macrospinosa]